VLPIARLKLKHLEPPITLSDDPNGEFIGRTTSIPIYMLSEEFEGTTTVAIDDLTHDEKALKKFKPRFVVVTNLEHTTIGAREIFFVEYPRQKNLPSTTRFFPCLGGDG